MGFFKNLFQGLGNFFSDPLNLNSRDREEEHFEQQQQNWEKEFALQKDQFEYQKWFDQNNVTLNLKQNMDAGINPLAAQGAGASSVSSSASPQQPSQGVGGADMSILGDFISQLGANRREDESLKVAKDKIDKDKDTQDQIIALKRDELGLEEKRTNSYADDVKARVLNLIQEYNNAVSGGYGRGSSLYKKILGEFIELDNKSPEEARNVLEEVFVPNKLGKKLAMIVKDGVKPKDNSKSKSKGDDTSDDWDAYLKYKLSAEKNGVRYYSYEQWRLDGKPRL